MLGTANPMFGKKGYWNGKHLPQKVVEAMSARMKGKGLLGDNNNAKKVIDTVSGHIYGSAKEVSILLNMKYGTFLAKLNGVNKNNTNYKYL